MAVMGAIWAEVKQNRKVGKGIYRLALHAPAIASQARPGQFVMLRVAHGHDPLLARPFSIHGAAGEELLILYKVVGRGTRLLSQVRPGQTLQLWGPLGRGFDLAGERPVLVAGGMGIAPLAFAAAELLKQNKSTISIYGGATKTEIDKIRNLLRQHFGRNVRTLDKFKNYLTLLNDLESISDKGPRPATPRERIAAFARKKEAAYWSQYLTATTISLTTSADGTRGDKGLVTDTLMRAFNKFPDFGDSVLACGPMPMLKAVARVCAQHGVACQVSLEAPMACGLGACLGCAIPAAGGGYLRACQEGPVLAAEAVDWERV
jgi:dihydroorotate dehydrogenase electron transfer subunit